MRGRIKNKVNQGERGGDSKHSTYIGVRSFKGKYKFYGALLKINKDKRENKLLQRRHKKHLKRRENQ